jgi:enoyl-CoA hydratase/carnithine racemase
LDYQYISVEEEDRFAAVTLCHEKRRNTLSEALLTELLHALENIGAGNMRGVVLAAQGPVFSAGHDFRDMMDRKLDSMRELLDVCARLMQTIQTIPQVVIAQVEGLATAAGCQLVATCDLAVAGQSARFEVPGGRGGWFCTTPGVALGRAVGRKHALEMLLTGDSIDAKTALEWGLINRVVPDAEVAKETRELLRRSTRGSAESKAIGKRAFYRQIDLETADAYAFASNVMADASQTSDAQEGLRAFLEKRRPNFSG